MLGGADIERLVHLKTLYLGPEKLLVAAKISVSLAPGDSVAEVAQAINDAEDRIRAAVPVPMVIYLEPDVFSAEGEGADPAV